jgi:hypothetical protein
LRANVIKKIHFNANKLAEIEKKMEVVFGGFGSSLDCASVKIIKHLEIWQWYTFVSIGLH